MFYKYQTAILRQKVSNCNTRLKIEAKKSFKGTCYEKNNNEMDNILYTRIYFFIVL